MLSMRPQSDEFAPFYATYVARVPDGQWDARLRAQPDDYRALLSGYDDDRANLPLGPGKWTLTEMLTHVADTERVFAFRLLWFARGEASELPGFDQDKWVASLGGGHRSVEEGLADIAAVRRSTLALLRSLPDEAGERRGVANGHPVSVRALAWIIPGHAEHHLQGLSASLRGA